MELSSTLRECIRTIPDFPKPGISFKDVTPVFQDPTLMRQCVDALRERFPAEGFDAVGGIEARGLIVGALMAHESGRPFFPFRKPGKLPWRALRESYQLEYGQNSLEMHIDAFHPGQRILVVDDLLATGGTASAAVRLIRRAQGQVIGIAFLVELNFLGGRRRLLAEGVEEESIVSLIAFGPGE